MQDSGSWQRHRPSWWRLVIPPLAVLFVMVTTSCEPRAAKKKATTPVTLAPQVKATGPTVITLPKATISFPDGSIADDAVIKAAPVGVNGAPTIAGVSVAGDGVQVDLGGATMSAPAVVSFKVPPPPPGATPVALHVTDGGTWELQNAEYADGQLVVHTTGFSIELPAFLNPLQLLSDLFGWATRLVGLRTSPPDCQAYDWAAVTGTSVVTHQCMGTNPQGQPELVIKSNRSYWLQVTVPQPHTYVWVEGVPGIVEEFVSQTFGGYFLPPGKTMTIGVTRPDSAMSVAFTATVRTTGVTQRITATDLALGDSHLELAAEIYTLVRCGYSDWGALSRESFRPTVESIFKCAVGVFSGLENDGKAIAAAESVFGRDAAVSKEIAPKLDAVAGRLRGFGKVVAILAAALATLTVVDQLAEEIAELWPGGQEPYINVVLNGSAPPPPPATQPQPEPQPEVTAAPTPAPTLPTPAPEATPATPVPAGPITPPPTQAPPATLAPATAPPATARPAPVQVAAYANYGDGASGIPMCRGNPARPESVPGGTVTQSFTVPGGVASIDTAMIQIDPDSQVNAHLDVTVDGTPRAAADAAAAGDTVFSFAPVPVTAGSTVTLSVTFSATYGKIITVYMVGNPGGHFTTMNSCSDGAANIDTTGAGLRATVTGWSG